MRLRNCAVLTRLLCALRRGKHPDAALEASTARSAREEMLVDQVTGSIRRRIAIFGCGIVSGLVLAAFAVVLRNAHHGEGERVATLIGHGVHRHGTAFEALNTMFPDVPEGCVDCPMRDRPLNSDGMQNTDHCTEAPTDTVACAFFVKG